MPGPLALCFSIAVVAVGAVVQGTVGFGLALLAGPLLTLVDPRTVPGPMLFAGLVLTLLMSARERSNLDASGVKWALVGRLPGVAVGAALLLVVRADALALLFGALVLLGVAMTVSGVALRPRPITLLLAGLLSGFMGTTASIGGPPMALVYSGADGPRVRATLSAYFVVGVLMSLIGLVLVGRFGSFELLWSLLLVPGVVIGFLLSARGARYIDRDRHRIRVGVLAVSAVSALVVIVRPFM